VSVLYLLPIAAAASLLGTRAALAALAVSAFCYGTLFVVDPPAYHGHDDHDGLAAHIVGMWAATALVALVIALLVGRTTAALRRRQEQVRALEDRSAREARLVSLSTLAAGAAHELGSPLATIAVAARELERGALEGSPRDELAADARLVREQLERCRAILAKLGTSAADPLGEAPEHIAAAEIVRDALVDLDPDLRERVDVEDAPDAQILAPRSPVVRALGNLLRNALDASPPDAHVSLAVEATRDRLRLRVRDRGAGMEPGVLARAGEPFFTTKPPGAGQGLGLFLARLVAEQLGGGLRVESAPGRGTTAVLEFRAAEGAE
jgi:two-component system sensor histidine kinase RegB